MMRRPKNADPLRRPKDKQKRRPQPSSAPAAAFPQGINGHTEQQTNGLKPPGVGQIQSIPQHSGRPTQPTPNLGQAGGGIAISGFSGPPVAKYTDYPLVLSKRALMDGFRHHVARFASKKNVDPRNPEEFTRPVRLHRRDPRAPSAGAGVKDEDHAMGMGDDADDKQREREQMLKAERDAKREAEDALVAPVTSSGQRKLGNNKKKTEQIYRNDQTDEQKARSKLRYEEALPWHLEDFDNKSTWVGTYEAALSESYAMITQGRDGVFRVQPLEKWYKFTQKGQFKTLTIEEAESRYNKKVKEPRWFMDSEESKVKRQYEQKNKKATSGLFLGKWEKGGGGSGQAKPVVKNEAADADDLDFTEDRFADDEENMLFEEDDETKEADERIKRDQLQANIFDLKEEKEYEKQEQLEQKHKDDEKRDGKKVKKALMKREKNYIYDSDSTDNPYSTASDSDSTETERLKEEEKKKTAAAAGTNTSTTSSPNKPLKKEKDKDKEKPPKQPGTSGSNTPSRRPEPLSRTASGSNLKRPGSPLGSEASGNESSRKKQKKTKHLHTTTTTSSQQQSQLQPPSRPNSPPIPASQQPSRQPSSSAIPTKRPRGQGSGSDSEGGGGAGSGGEMSDGTRKRIKLKLNMGKNGSPNGSRAGSPEAGRAGGGSCELFCPFVSNIP